MGYDVGPRRCLQNLPGEDSTPAGRHWPVNVRMHKVATSVALDALDVALAGR